MAAALTRASMLLPMTLRRSSILSQVHVASSSPGCWKKRYTAYSNKPNSSPSTVQFSLAAGAAASTQLTRTLTGITHARQLHRSLHYLLDRPRSSTPSTSRRLFTSNSDSLRNESNGSGAAAAVSAAHTPNPPSVGIDLDEIGCCNGPPTLSEKDIADPRRGLQRCLRRMDELAEGMLNEALNDFAALTCSERVRERDDDDDEQWNTAASASTCQRMQLHGSGSANTHTSTSAPSRSVSTLPSPISSSLRVLHHRLESIRELRRVIEYAETLMQTAEIRHHPCPGAGAESAEADHESQR